MKTVKVAILASGRGSNFAAILENINAGKCNSVVKVLITNNPNAPAIKIAEDNRVPVEILDRSKFATRLDMDDYIKTLLDKYGVDLVVLAGYMLLLKSKKLLDAYRNRIINIHPALLPSFPGADAQKQAFEYGAKISGVTIHFVDESLDAGPIIYQEPVDISNCRNAEEVAKKILSIEHSSYSKVVDSFSKGHYVIKEHRVEFVPD